MKTYYLTKESTGIICQVGSSLTTQMMGCLTLWLTVFRFIRRRGGKRWIWISTISWCFCL